MILSRVCGSHSEVTRPTFSHPKLQKSVSSLSPSPCLSVCLPFSFSLPLPLSPSRPFQNLCSSFSIALSLLIVPSVSHAMILYLCLIQSPPYLFLYTMAIPTFPGSVLKARNYSIIVKRGGCDTERHWGVGPLWEAPPVGCEDRRVVGPGIMLH